MKKAVKHGFTVIELVIVIAVIAILASVIVAVAAGTITRANATATASAVAELNKALKAESHTGNIPHDLGQCGNIR